MESQSGKSEWSCIRCVTLCLFLRFFYCSESVVFLLYFIMYILLINLFFSKFILYLRDQTHNYIKNSYIRNTSIDFTLKILLHFLNIVYKGCVFVIYVAISLFLPPLPSTLFYISKTTN
jgi:hypothetical protein